jgi:mRNA interferase RelE/StbE
VIRQAQENWKAEIVYTVELKPKAEKDLKAMERREARAMYDAPLKLESGLSGDIKKLTDHRPEYRLRIGNWRAIFEIEGNRIIVYRIRHCKEAYR